MKSFDFCMLLGSYTSGDPGSSRSCEGFYLSKVIEVECSGGDVWYGQGWCYSKVKWMDVCCFAVMWFLVEEGPAGY